MNTYVVVFDTNILFSGLGWQGSPFRCLELAREGQVIFMTCQEILAELEEKLRLKQNMSFTEAAQDVAQVLSFSRLVTINNTLKVITDDPDDDMVLDCAVVGGASTLLRWVKNLENHVQFSTFYLRVLLTRGDADAPSSLPLR